MDENLKELHVVVTARPSWARVKSIVQNFSRIHGKSAVRILLVGPAVSSRYGDLTSQIENEYLLDTFSTLQESDNFTSVSVSATEGAATLSRYWALNRPAMVLFVADRTETLGVAMAASIMQIPLIHLQGGEKSGSIDDKIRDANSKLADYHLTTNNESYRRLVEMGERDETIEIIGCPSIDLVTEVISGRTRMSLPKKAADLGGVGSNFDLDSRFGIVMFHPDTLFIDDNLKWMDFIFDCIENLKSTVTNWFWFWPNPDHGSHQIAGKIRNMREGRLQSEIRFLINVSPETFLQLAIHAEVLIGNSSFGIREASFIGLPTINIGKRQSMRQRGHNVLDISEPSKDPNTFHEIESFFLPGNVSPSLLYGDGKAGQKAAEAISKWIKNPKLKNELRP